MLDDLADLNKMCHADIPRSGDSHGASHIRVGLSLQVRAELTDLSRERATSLAPLRPGVNKPGVIDDVTTAQRPLWRAVWRNSGVRFIQL